MPVIPDNHFLTDYSQTLQKLIFSAPQNQDYEGEIISISQEINPLDLLVFLAMMKPAQQVSFYCENQRKEEAVVGLGALVKLEVNQDNLNDNNNTLNRFQICQNFINKYQHKINFQDNLDGKKIPYFFSTFNFVAQGHNSCQSFPQAQIFIPHIQLFKRYNQYIITVNTFYGSDAPELTLIKQYLSHNFSENLTQFYQDKNNNNSSSLPIINSNNYQSFLDKVNRGLQAIERGELLKIVIAHALEIELKRPCNIIKSLENLRKNHPDCYIFAVGNNQEEYFIGASPERLLSIQDRQLVTDALAGSAPRGRNEYNDSYLGENLLNSEKEKREHEIVSQFLSEQLLKLGLTPKKASLQLLKLSNIQHLWTPIYAEIIETINPLEIIAKLHPTPAVAGIPIDVACAEISAYENFDRSLYAAPIGWLDTNGNCEFIVGIRSALIRGNKARLYAGAGIVAGSKPEQELNEIELKFQVLLRALENN